ncbi:MAG: TlyA family RNA methyltransferase [Defluviitaleaceae bacterium]|nr:TlyA family RNA methyltransferase [Defluviitaleaceae bacterium]
MESKRLDALVCGLLGVSREYAKDLIQKGKVMVDGKTIIKPGAKFAENTAVVVDADPPKYVSRGGLKLEKAFEVFGFDVYGLNCMDVGASTGGFTDCMLQYGANKVFAVENGHGQMVEKFLKDPRVISREGLDIRDLELADLPFAPQFAAVDLSFISLTHVLPKISELLENESEALLLVKPQFEVGRGKVGKNGVVKNPKDHIEVLNKVCDAACSCGLQPVAVDFSPITGQNGNLEYLLLVEKTHPSNVHLALHDVTHVGIKRAVNNAFKEIKA